jgi:HEPN domain-containing protein
VNRSDFQELAEVHLQHAKALLDAQLYSGAYYMCGYVVECALKACICKKTSEFDFYPSPEESRAAWSHDFKKLLKAAGLESELSAARVVDPDLNVNWESVANNWSPDSRYEPHGQREAQLLFDAIADPDHGVLSCLKQLW